MARRPLAQIISAGLAAASGVFQGQEEAKLRREEEEQQRTRQVLSLLPQLQSQQDREIEGAMAAYPSGQELSYLTPEAASQAMTDRRNAYTSLQSQRQDFTAPLLEYVQRSRKDKRPLSIPTRQPLQITQPSRPYQARNPKEEAAKSGFVSDIDSWRAKAMNDGDTEGAIALQEIQNGVTSGSIPLEVAQVRFKDAVKNFQAKGQGKERLSRSQKAGTELQDLIQQGMIVDTDLAEGNALAGELLAADASTADAVLKKYQDYRKRARLQESSTSRANKATGQRIEREFEQKRLDDDFKMRASAVDKALASKVPQQFSIALEGLQNFVDKHPEYADRVQNWNGIDARRQRIAYKKPVFSSVVTAEDLDHPSYVDAEREETIPERDARLSGHLADLWRKEDPAVGFKAAQSAVNQEWGIVKDANADEASRIEAMQHIQQIAAKYPGLTVPRTIPKFVGSPWVQKQLEMSQLRFLQDLRKYDEEEQKRDVELKTAQRRYDLLGQQSAKMVADLAKLQREARGSLTEVEKEMAKKLGEEHKDALDAYHAVRNLPPEKRPDPIEWQNNLMIARKNLSAAEGKRMEFIQSKGNVQLPPSTVPPSTPMGAAPKRRVRGKLNKEGFDTFDLQTIKGLQQAGKTYEEATNIVRRDNGGR